MSIHDPISQLRAYYVQKVLPAVYDDSLSYYELLCKVQEKLEELVNAMNTQYTVNDGMLDLIEQLQTELQDFKEHGFDDYYKEQVAEWVDENFQTIMNGLLGHMLFFGLTDDGYFTTYIPEMWAIAFDTDVDYNSENYGCLEIKY